MGDHIINVSEDIDEMTLLDKEIPEDEKEEDNN